MGRKFGSSISRARSSLTSSRTAHRTNSSPLSSQSNDYSSVSDIKKGFSKPRSFVSASSVVDQVRVPEYSNQGSAVKLTTGTSNDADSARPISTSTLCARVIKPYRAFNAQELTIREGDMIHNVVQIGLKDWFKGNVGGMVGYFPATHVVLMLSDVQDNLGPDFKLTTNGGNSNSNNSPQNYGNSNYSSSSATTGGAVGSLPQHPYLNSTPSLPISPLQFNVNSAQKSSGARHLPVAPSANPLPFLAMQSTGGSMREKRCDERKFNDDIIYADMEAFQDSASNSRLSFDSYDSEEYIYEDADKHRHEVIYESFT
eukprot:CFRG1233T1